MATRRKIPQVEEKPVKSIEKKKKGKQNVYDNPRFNLKQFLTYACSPEDASFLAVFRILWALVMGSEIYAHMKDNFVKIRAGWYSTPYLFKYWGFEWVHPLPLEYMQIFLYVMLFASVCMAVGFYYRTACVIFFFGFAYMFLLEAALYLNHFYLCILISLMMIILPCNVCWSIDSYLNPKLRSATVPRLVLHKKNKRFLP